MSHHFILASFQLSRYTSHNDSFYQGYNGPTGASAGTRSPQPVVLLSTIWMESTLS